MFGQPRVSKNQRNRQHYNKAKNCTCNKPYYKCRRPCDSCININININNCTGGTDCFAVNDRCNTQLTICYAIVGDNLLGRLACEEAYNNCFLNAGCQQGGGGGPSDTCPKGEIEAWRACVNRCVRDEPGRISPCIDECTNTYCRL